MEGDRSDRRPFTLRDKLALDRNRLANERTVLAYIRTAIMLAVSGVTSMKLFADYRLAVVAGWILVASAIVNVVVGNWRFITTRRALRQESKTTE